MKRLDLDVLLAIDVLERTVGAAPTGYAVAARVTVARREGHRKPWYIPQFWWEIAIPASDYLEATERLMNEGWLVRVPDSEQFPHGFNTVRWSILPHRRKDVEALRDVPRG